MNDKDGYTHTELEMAALSSRAQSACLHVVATDGFVHVDSILCLKLPLEVNKEPPV